MNYVITYLPALLLLAVYLQGTYGTQFSCDEEFLEHGVPYCPRPLIDDSDEMRCCTSEGEIIPSTGIRIKIYGCCTGFPDYIYIIAAVIGAVIIGSFILCCYCCCCRRSQNRGFVIFQNPPVIATTVAPPAAQPAMRSAGEPI